MMTDPNGAQQPYTNMFASDLGSVDPKYPVNTLLGNFIKSHGGTVIGSYGYSISPSSSRAAISTAQSFQRAGGKVGVLDTTVPFGSVDFTSTALVAKQKGINSMVPALDNNSNYALATALKQAGVKMKAEVFATGYEPDVIKSPAWNTLQGAYFLALFRPFSLPNAGTQQMQAAMEKYAHFTKTQFPTFGQYESWAGADLMIKGIQMAGKNPTRAAVIKDLRGLKSYNANGLLPAVDQLLDDLRARLAGLHVVHEGRGQRVRPGVLSADLREGHRRYVYGDLVVDVRTGAGTGPGSDGCGEVPRWPDHRDPIRDGLGGSSAGTAPCHRRDSSGYRMNSTRLPSGSRTYTLEAGTWRPPRRSTGPSMMVAAAPSSSTSNDSADPSHTRQMSPHGGSAAGARSVKSRTAPHLGAMEVDHLGAEMDLDQVGGLRDREAERAVEARHGFGCPASGVRCGRNRRWTRPVRGQLAQARYSNPRSLAPGARVVPGGVGDVHWADATAAFS